MRIFVGMETSGRVREAMRRRGHHAISCDFLPSDDGSIHHIQGDVLDHVLDFKPDLAIFHPTCRWVAASGALHLYIDGLKTNGRNELRWEKMIEGAHFFRRLLELPIPKIAVENPRMLQEAIDIVGRRADQAIQPNHFGEDASKRTFLWLQGLRPLVATHRVAPRIVDGRPRWGNQTDSGQNNVPDSKNRWKIRSATFPGIAEAFAAQWTPDLKGHRMPFVRYEVRPVIEQNPGDDKAFCESFITRAEWQARVEACTQHGIEFEAFWSLYGVNEDGTSDCVADFTDEDHAFEIMDAILGVPRQAAKLLNEGPYSARKEALGMLVPLLDGSTRREQL